jgi:WD40 repeat protein
VGTTKGSVRVLSCADFSQLIAHMSHCKEAIDELKYSPDGSKLASGSHDNFIDVYSVQHK